MQQVYKDYLTYRREFRTKFSNSINYMDFEEFENKWNQEPKESKAVHHYGVFARVF